MADIIDLFTKEKINGNKTPSQTLTDLLMDQALPVFSKIRKMFSDDNVHPLIAYTALSAIKTDVMDMMLDNYDYDLMRWFSDSLDEAEKTVKNRRKKK